MGKYKVKITERIEHTFEVEEFNKFMAEAKAKQLLKEQKVKTDIESVDVQEK